MSKCGIAFCVANNLRGAERRFNWFASAYACCCLYAACIRLGKAGQRLRENEAGLDSSIAVNHVWSMRRRRRRWRRRRRRRRRRPRPGHSRGGGPGPGTAQLINIPPYLVSVLPPPTIRGQALQKFFFGGTLSLVMCQNVPRLYESVYSINQCEAVRNNKF